MTDKNTKSSQAVNPHRNGGLSSAEVDDVMLARAENSEKQLLAELERSDGEIADEKAEKHIIFEFEEVPEELVFSEFAQYRLLNRETKRSFIINGKQVEARIGLDSGLRSKVKSRAVKVFCVDNNVIAFDCARLF